MKIDETTERLLDTSSPIDPAVFDLHGTLKRLGGDRELLADLILLFQEDSPAWLDRISKATGASQAAELRHAAHALRGLAANFGAARLTQTLFQIEEQAASGTVSDIAKFAGDARQETEQLKDALMPYRHVSADHS